MSFFKKLKNELKEMLDMDDQKTEQKHGAPQGSHENRNTEPTAGSGAGEYSHQPNFASPAPQGPQTQHYQQQQQQQQQQQYPTGPHEHAGSQSYPQVPPGWVAQYDSTLQRYYYVEQATGRSQWELPTANTNRNVPDWNPHAGSPYQPPQPYQPTGNPGFQHQHGYAAPVGMPYQSNYDTAQRDHHGQPSFQQPQQQQQQQHKSGTGMGTAVAAGVGGAAAGALAMHALSDDDEQYTSNAAMPPGAAPPGVPLEDNPQLASSQRSSLEEARLEYEEAAAHVASGGSSASSSDLEELQEAREEYQDEIEDAQDELDD